MLAEFATGNEAKGVVEESDEQTERRAKGVDEGEEKGGGNKRKEVEPRRDKREKKKRRQTKRGEASAGDWIMDTGGTRGCYPWARTLQRAIGGQGRKEQCSRGQMYLGEGARYGVR